MYAKLLPLLGKAKWSASRLMDHFLQSERIKAALTSILADFVVRPEEFQGLGVALLNPEPAFDRRVPLKISRFGRQPSYVYIDGGCRTLIDLLAGAVRKRGGVIHTGCAVTAIRTQERRSSCGCSHPESSTRDISRTWRIFPSWNRSSWCSSGSTSIPHPTWTPG
ncbi:MAG TPA: hypothetical protein VMW69_05345 [Spirochaetia bacterium]|nr:hypothetical protein [Spirochaetia bacterium]